VEAGETVSLLHAMTTKEVTFFYRSKLEFSVFIDPGVAAKEGRQGQKRCGAPTKVTSALNPLSLVNCLYLQWGKHIHRGPCSIISHKAYDITITSQGEWRRINH
jgi:hypothetical protein